ncbi:hypothetical protein DUI87_10896 [Hirundo rustica rustica]|uniref:Uncharacterized protein n=1 Tax=Hirundo rustica rustica TaxID=333673 RepID=A0A3M0KJC3_HIRRU|nr:hypothetical protein DUI87_10893 [Hirundo rustica rustica]RMC13361.1 hypothetical protein DUI87_10896 [Hirundo rustica rustica]
MLVGHFWALIEILVLLLVLWFGLGKIRHDPDSSDHKERSSCNLVEEEEAEGHNVVAKKEIECNNANVEEDNEDGNDGGSNVEAKAESNAGN